MIKTLLVKSTSRTCDVEGHLHLSFNSHTFSSTSRWPELTTKSRLMRHVFVLILFIFVRSSSFSQQVILHNDTISASDNFGGALSISGNGQYLVVGAATDEVDGICSGSVSVFESTGDLSWNRITTFTAADAEDMDGFGTAVDISFDGSRIVVGAPLEDEAASNGGSVYVFDQAGMTWNMYCKIISPDSIPTGQFGKAVAINHAGDNIVVGEPDYKSEFFLDEVGAAHFFYDTTGCFTLSISVFSDTMMDNADFGFSVDLNAAGDFAIIGAPKESVYGSIGEGAVYIYNKKGVFPWTLHTKIPSPENFAREFGWDVVFANDSFFAAVSAPGITNMAAGKVYMLINNNTEFEIAQTIVEPDSLADPIAGFGQSIALDGPAANLLIGAPRANFVFGISTGAALLYSRIADTLQLNALYYSFDMKAQQLFGASVDLSDNLHYAAVGAPFRKEGALDFAGAVFVNNLFYSCLEVLKVNHISQQSNVYRADQFIEINIPIDSLRNSLFLAGNHVLFQPEFASKENSTLTTINQTCVSGVD